MDFFIKFYHSLKTTKQEKFLRHVYAKLKSYVIK